MTKGDLIVICASLLVVVGSFAWLWGRGGGEWVEIQAGNGALERLSLWEPRHIKVAGKQGETSVDIEPGRVRITDSPCNERVCVLAGWLDQVGDSAACLPNGVLITISGRAGTRFDAINF